MDSVMKVMFAPVLPFLSHPERAYLLAVFFAILLTVSLVRSGRFKPRHHVVMFFAVLAWLFFGLIEGLAITNGWNIRVDLFLTWPVVLAASMGAAWAGFRNFTEPCEQNADEPPSEGPPHRER